MIEKLRQLLLQRPFLPFEIVLSDGSRLRVGRRLQVAVGQTRFAYVDDAGFHHLSERQIKELQPAGEVKR